MEDIEASSKTAPTALETVPKSEHKTTVDLSDDDAIIPQGQIDPVFEAKARVLNHAVRSPSYPVPWQSWPADLSSRSKISAWDGTNGSSSSSSDLAGHRTISGP